MCYSKLLTSIQDVTIPRLELLCATLILAKLLMITSIQDAMQSELSRSCLLYQLESSSLVDKGTSSWMEQNRVNAIWSLVSSQNVGDAALG